MNLLFWGLTVGTIGKAMLAVGVLIAHTELAHERKIDKLVLKSFRLEHSLTIAGLVLIVAGYGMEIYFYDFVSMLTCFGSECALNAAAILSQ
ncbi:hypothetical protein H6781_02700 [Candidatus Nomurabacteria bacterium]|nr:hypothetical protein [Candidatus Kaiserbacteria bacterium]MCB9810479.1 hypothetical protein [Candidatus Nomurabacteria bacterium]MCB9815569.1 hypothetical protein [Candidatus Nomurabacteria bacterium]MCB9818192.1 hypothetical protein [Candidatus Nomurabacteria bacterium]